MLCGLSAIDEIRWCNTNLGLISADYGYAHCCTAVGSGGRGPLARPTTPTSPSLSVPRSFSLAPPLHFPSWPSSTRCTCTARPLPPAHSARHAAPPNYSRRFNSFNNTTFAPLSVYCALFFSRPLESDAVRVLKAHLGDKHFRLTYFEHFNTSISTNTLLTSSYLNHTDLLFINYSTYITTAKYANITVD